MNRIVGHLGPQLAATGRLAFMRGLRALVGDIHNHSGISYGYGRAEDAIAFARQQLDFFSVTGHFAWPDMETGAMGIPDDVMAYHRSGFAKLRRVWPEFRKAMAEAESGDFIPFLSYEYHSFRHGDYTILCRDIAADLPQDPPEGESDSRLDDLLAGGREQTANFLCTPHHIGYKEGYRGISWKSFNEAVSPCVEIVSMHGAAESHEARPSYLHTMGPRSAANTYQGGLSLGKHFGVVGSTDHHNSAPGSYGSGRTVLYAPALSRDDVWGALASRRTTAASGDPIEAVLFANGAFMGEIAPRHDGKIAVDGFVSAWDKLEKVEVIQDGRPVAARYDFPSGGTWNGCVAFMFGWGKKHMPAVWDIRLTVEGGDFLGASPRLRGIDMVDPLDVPEDGAAFLPRYSKSADGVSLHVVTNGNTTATTDCSQGFVIDVDGSPDTSLRLEAEVEWGGKKVRREWSWTLGELKDNPQTDYVDGFVSPAVMAGAFRERGETSAHIHALVDTESQGAVYLRAVQKNGDSVWTSPVSFRDAD